jgi:trimethylamine--corrinoid protein Co-methyltransferase
MDCEIFSIIEKTMRGIEVNDDTLALETIAAVGPCGNFLTQKHTRQHMRDLFLPQFMDRRPYNEWESRKDNARDWALAKARRVLAEHHPEPLDPSLSREMDQIIATLEN